jgi:hypothetical protein
VIDPTAEIEQLTAAFPGRKAGSDAERRAANHLTKRLTALGREAHTEPTTIWPRWPLVHLIHATAAIAGSALSIDHPLIGTILIAAALASTLAEVTGRVPIARRITGRRASQNVVSAEDIGKPGTLILTAHYDAARGGSAFGERVRQRTGPAAPFVWSLVLLLATAAAREAGLDDSSALKVVQFVPTVVLIFYVPFLADILLSGTVPGANDNASGAVTVLRLAERYGGPRGLDHFDVRVLLTGAQETGAQGMREWLGTNRRQLDPLRTVVLNVDEVGAGTIRYARKEGPLLALKQHPRLVRLCEQIAAEDAEDGRYGAIPVTKRTPGDAYAARSRSIPAITISCGPAPHHHRPTDTPDNVDRQSLDRAFRFCSELIELIDEQIGPDIASSAETQASFTPS